MPACSSVRRPWRPPGPQGPNRNPGPLPLSLLPRDHGVRTEKKSGAGAGMIIESQKDVTVAAIAAMERTPDPRMREIMVSLVKHLHGSIRDTSLPEEDFREATAILGELGRRTTDTHNEM